VGAVVSGGPDGAELPMDETDVLLLAELRALWTEADPVPATLTRQVSFALDLTRLDAEVAQLVRLEQPELVRGGDTRSISFETDALSVMVGVTGGPDGTVRLDGWLAPPAPHRVTARTEGREVTATADEGGRFALPAVPSGLTQLIVVPAAGSGLDSPVVTPAFEL
jgi:hypothetical protein